MFEISGSDVSSLGDADLRSLVQRLAMAELRLHGCALSAITAGGNQDAADGGLDVRVESPSVIDGADFVPRRLTGFQVKKPDMPASAIREEMRPNGVLREVIQELADASGAYVIVSAQGSVADKSLADRRKAIRDALHDLKNATQLHTDFYDRDRLAIWINEYPGIVSWVRSKVGRPLSGWSAIGDWEGSGGARKPYLFDEQACLIDERLSERKHLTILEGIAILRALLRTPKQCIRLVGLSGLGKTRLVQALFEEGVGKDRLEPSLTVYTDYSEETSPSARDMARGMVDRDQRAILVVDNCNPATHSELVRLCTSEASRISLITVEYDVRDDEPERTEVFRLQSASPKLVTQWLKQDFPGISQIDRDKITTFSDGNFRVARALAQTLAKGETLGSLKDRELFKRIFLQRNEPDQHLLRAAEDLSLLYSIEVEDLSPEGELAHVGGIREIGARSLYEALTEMTHRGVVQSRGRFRAVLPHAIANPLASYALERIPPADFDRFCASLPPRMLQSVSRRLGLLHDSNFAQAVVVRWLSSDGPVGDLFERGAAGRQIVTNIAPVSPEAVLIKLERAVGGLNDHLISGPQFPSDYQWFPLIKSLAYDAPKFERAVALLARLLTSEQEGQKNDAARDIFGELFHLHLSGTQATPEQRRAAIRLLALSGKPGLLRVASIGLRAMFESGHFSSMSSFDFGARSRDWGWQPKSMHEKQDWFVEAIALAVELEPHLSDARTILAGSVRSLWNMAACRDAIDHAATALSLKRPWIEGWISLRDTLRFDGKSMPEEICLCLKQLINRLKPTDLLNQARAIILNRTSSGWDVVDGEDDDDDAIRRLEKVAKMAMEVGRLLAADTAIRFKFLAELLVAPQPQRAFECGRGLGQGTDNLGMIWSELVIAYEAAETRKRNPTVIGGFLYEAHQRDSRFAEKEIEAAIDNPAIVSIVPYLQALIGIEEEGIARLRRALAKGGLSSGNFEVLANGCVSNSPPEPLGALLEDIAVLPNGIEVALDILAMHFHSSLEEGQERNARIVAVGRDLLGRLDFSRIELADRDYTVHNVIRICLGGESARTAAERVCANLRSVRENIHTSARDHSHILRALFEMQPIVALDKFLLPKPPPGDDLLFDLYLPDFGTWIIDVNPAILQQWAETEPATRYPILGKCLSLFGKENDGEENILSPIFLLLLGSAPDKLRFLGESWGRLHPGSWSGSLADILACRKEEALKLLLHADEHVRAWIRDAMPELDHWIEHDRGRARKAEESFE